VSHKTKLRIIIFCILMLLLASGCDNPFEHSKCRMTEVGQSRSPNGEHKAIAHEYFCKPRQDVILETQIEVSEIKQRRRETGETVLILRGKHAIQAVWLNDTNLQIECSDECSNQISAKLNKWGDIKISYKLK
jgi:hypothetical protein